MKNLDHIASRSYKSYKSRLRAAERLQARQRAWNTCLLALSIATTIASIALLTDSMMYGKAGPTVLVCVSVLGLVSSLAVAGLNYGVRSRDMFMNYRGLQRLSVEAESLQEAGEDVDGELVARLSQKHDALLDDSENHTEADFRNAFPVADASPWPVRKSAALTVLPYVALAVPVAVLLPFVLWVASDGTQ